MDLSLSLVVRFFSNDDTSERALLIMSVGESSQQNFSRKTGMDIFFNHFRLYQVDREILPSPFPPQWIRHDFA